MKEANVASKVFADVSADLDWLMIDIANPGPTRKRGFFFSLSGTRHQLDMMKQQHQLSDLQERIHLVPF